MNTPPTVRLYLFFANESDKALILRRAKDRLYNLIGWDRLDDSFTEGQWIKKYVRPEFCSLSPNGQYFMYYVANADMRQRASEHYTVISLPPWFTALALFPQGGLWCAGGHFLSNKQYVIEGGAAAKDIIGRATGLQQIVKGEKTKDCRTGLRLRNGQPAPLSRALRNQLLNGEAPQRNSALDQYEAHAGCLYRLRNGDRHLIRDFTEMEPQFIRAPYETRPEEDVDEQWHPLMDET